MQAVSTRAENNPIKEALTHCRTALPALILFSCLINILILASPIYMMQVFDRVLSSGRTETLLYLTLIAGVAVLVMGAIHMARSQILARIARWLGRRLAPDLIASCTRAALNGFSAGAQPLRDLSTIRGFVSGSGINAVFDAPWVPLFVAVIWLLHPWLGMVALGAAVMIFVVALLNEYLSRKPLRASNVVSLSGYRDADAAVRNADVFQAMGMLPNFLASWTRRQDEGLDQQLKAGDRSAALLGFSRFFRVFAQVAILGVGAYLVLESQLSSGGMIAASILLGRALAPVEQAMGAWKGLVAARDAHGRLKRLFEQAPVTETAMALPAPEGRLACEQVMWVPNGREEPVLNGVSFALEPGEALGMIGPSAAGKSSLCRMLVGTAAPTRGHVRLDGADLFAWPADDLGPAIGYLPQDVELFSGTVKANIARLWADAEPAEIVAAAKLAGVHDMILRLSDGYDTEIGDDGSLLSGGQRQRIGLARALFGRPKLIVLDEPNANLDQDGELALMTAIEAAKGWGATIVLVAHHPRILGQMDKLMVLRDGQVAVFGPRDDILAQIMPRPKTVATTQRSATPVGENAAVQAGRT